MILLRRLAFFLSCVSLLGSAWQALLEGRVVSQPELHNLLEEFVETSVKKSSDAISDTPLDKNRICAS